MSSVSNGLYFLTIPLVSVTRVIYRKIRHARYLYIKRNVEKVWGARYLSKNTVIIVLYCTGRPRTSEEDVERIRQSCIRSPKKSISRRSVTLGIPKTTIQNVLYKCLRLHAYKIQLKQEIKPDDRQEIEFRLDVSRATNGAHIEMY